MTRAAFAAAVAALTLSQTGASIGRLVGTEVEARLLRNDPAYTAVVKREFNVIVPDHEMKFGYVGKRRGEYDFSDADYIVDFAAKNGMKVRGHTLIWHHNLPKWLKEGHFTGKELEKILKDHIQTEVSHFAKKFPGRVFAWDVVNEGLGKDGKPRRESPWAAIGKNPGDYIPIAFRAAEKADPHAELFYSDFGIDEINKKSDALYDLIYSMKAVGVPIDGIGFQMHLDDHNPVSVDSVRKNWERFAKLGLKIQITEFDYALPTPPTPEQIDHQSKAYHDFAQLCASTPACEAFVTWGFTDAHSWIPESFHGYGSALYFDEQYEPKPAYQALRSGLTR